MLGRVEIMITPLTASFITGWWASPLGNHPSVKDAVEGLILKTNFLTRPNFKLFSTIFIKKPAYIYLIMFHHSRSGNPWLTAKNQTQTWGTFGCCQIESVGRLLCHSIDQWEETSHIHHSCKFQCNNKHIQHFWMASRVYKNFISPVTSCVGLQEEPQTDYPRSITWVSYEADTMLTGR